MKYDFVILQPQPPLSLAPGMHDLLVSHCENTIHGRQTQIHHLS